MVDTFDFEPLESSEHMLRWLSNDPFATLRDEFESTLNAQVPGSVLLGLKVRGEPEWLTGVVRTEQDPTQAILVRTGVAFEFELSVKTPDTKVHDLAGVFTWVGVHLNDPANAQQRTWFDLNGDIGALGASGELNARMYFDQMPAS